MVLQIAESVDESVAELLRQEDFAKFLDDPRVNGMRVVDFDPLKTNVIAVLSKPEIDQTNNARMEIIDEYRYGANIVTDAGDIFYAKAAVGEAQSANEDFLNGNFVLQNPGIQDSTLKTDTYLQVTTPIAATLKAFVATPNYPLRNDADPDNTGAGVDVVTYLVSYTTGDFNDTGINGGAILNDLTTPATTALLLTHFLLTSFNKTASDTLKVFVNHTMNGV